jgi:hypothetical protein
MLHGLTMKAFFFRSSFSTPLVCAALALAAAAQTVHYSTGFEAPTYVPGTLAGSTLWNGQDGWVATGDSGNDPDFAKIAVQSALVNSGTQAVSIDATGQPCGYAHIRRHVFINVTPAEPLLDIAFDLRIASAATTPSEWGIQSQVAPGPARGSWSGGSTSRASCT